MPTTLNGGLIIPNTGDLPGTWGSNALNPNFVSIDGLFGGATTISASNALIVLTSPSGFAPTPSAGPTQAQNAVLQFTGTLTANVQVTLPIPGYCIINNQTTRAFVLSFRAIGSGQVIAVDQQDDVHIYNNGTNVRFVNLGRIGGTAAPAGTSLSGIPITTGPTNVAGASVASGSGSIVPGSTSASWGGVSSTFAASVSSNNTGGQSHPNVQPSQVTGIMVIRAG